MRSHGDDSFRDMKRRNFRQRRCELVLNYSFTLAMLVSLRSKCASCERLLTFAIHLRLAGAEIINLTSAVELNKFPSQCRISEFRVWLAQCYCFDSATVWSGRALQHVSLHTLTPRALVCARVSASRALCCFYFDARPIGLRCCEKWKRLFSLNVHTRARHAHSPALRREHRRTRTHTRNCISGQNTSRVLRLWRSESQCLRHEARSRCARSLSAVLAQPRRPSLSRAPCFRCRQRCAAAVVVASDGTHAHSLRATTWICSLRWSCVSAHNENY